LAFAKLRNKFQPELNQVICIKIRLANEAAAAYSIGKTAYESPAGLSNEDDAAREHKKIPPDNFNAR